MFEEKILTLRTALIDITHLPRPIVLTNGVFDILHRGHVTYLAQARQLGGSLIVAVNTDHSVKKLCKGENRPLNACEDRMVVLAALSSVDKVIAFEDNTALAIVQHIQPDIYVKGADYDIEKTPEGEAVLAYGGKVTTLRFLEGYSTTRLLNKARQSA